MEGIREKRKLDPIDDALYNACVVYMALIARGDSKQKNRQYALIEELLLDRLDAGETYLFPSEEDLPSEQLRNSDTITEGQSIKLVAGIMRELEARRKSPYVG